MKNGMFKNLFRKKMLLGVDAIMSFAGWHYITTVSDRMIAYSDHCPIRREGGILVVEKKEFKKWLKKHPDAAEEITRAPFDLIQHKKVMLKYGQEKELNRRIIF